MCDKKTMMDKLKLPIDNNFPIELANNLASMERYNKHLYRPNNYLHKWWARRCGTTFRSILKSLVADDSKTGYYTPGGLENKLILDPMMGGGTTLHEAIRLNANVIGIDIDPISFLQVKAGLKKVDISKLNDEFNNFFNYLRTKNSEFFLTQCPHCSKSSEIRFVLYGLRKKCMCREIISVDSFTLKEERNNKIEICPKCGKVFSSVDSHICTYQKTLFIEKTMKKCEHCRESFVDDYNIPLYERFEPFCIVGHCEIDGEFYKNIAEEDISKIREAKKRYLANEFLTDDFKISQGPKSNDLIKKGINQYTDLFSFRQLLIMNDSIDYIKNIENNDIQLILSLLVSTSLEFNSVLCGYKGSAIRRPGAIRHVFSHHAYSIPHTSLENNPISSKKSSGNLLYLYEQRFLKAKKWADNPVENDSVTNKKVIIAGEKDYGNEVIDYKELIGQKKFLLLNIDSSYLPLPNDFVDFIVTDPPYFNNVQYSNLSEFFRVWLKFFLPKDVSWNIDISRSAVSNEFGDNYRNIMSSIFNEANRVLKKENGRLIFTFHHWDPKAWTDITISLKNAGFYLTNKYVVISENPISVHINGLKALNHDVILVFTSEKPSIKKWNFYSNIDKTKSEKFCEMCGELLGWILENNTTTDKILDIWKQAI